MIAIGTTLAEEREKQAERDDWLALLLLILADIAADHDERERGLIAFFLALAKLAYDRVTEAVKGGHDWRRSLRDVFRGRPELDLADPAPILASGMSDSYARGQWRAATAAGVARPFLGRAERMERFYRPQAETALNAAVLALENRITGLLEVAPTLPDALEAIAEAFRLAGWMRDNLWAARRAAANAVLPAYAAGMGRAYFDDPEVMKRLTGLRYVAVLDKGTTPICRAYHNVVLPPDHAWWRSHFPMNHWGCRSVAMPILGEFTPTENPPWNPPPEPGFGMMPLRV